MKISILFTFTVLIIFFPACNSATQEEKIQQPTKETIKKKPPGINRDTVLIKGPSAVFFNADSVQWDQIRSVTDPGIFESLRHDCFYQQRNARKLLSVSFPFVSVIENGRARWLNFLGNEGTRFIIDLDAQADACGLFLFNGIKKPRLTDMTNIDTELGQYF